MRIATTQIYTQGIKAFGVQQTKLANLQEQISTGTRILKPSDDPIASARSLELEQTIKLNTQFQENIVHARNRLQLEESTLAGIGNALQRVRELALQGINATQDPLSRRSIAVEIDQLHEQLLSLANTVDANGDYLFAGHQSRERPFTLNTTGAITHVEFNGDQGLRAINISETRQMNVGSPGRELFMQIPSDTALNVSPTLVDPLNPGNLEIAPAYVFDKAAYTDGPPGNYRIVFNNPANTFDIIDVDGVTQSGTPPAPNPPGTVIDRRTYSDSGIIDFKGIRTSITGTPAAGDTFDISPGQNEDMFSMVANLSETLKSPFPLAPLRTEIARTAASDIQISEPIITDATRALALDADTFQPITFTFDGTNDPATDFTSTSDVTLDGGATTIPSGTLIPYTPGMEIESVPALWQVTLSGANPQGGDDLVIDVNESPGAKIAANISQTILDIDSSMEKGLDIRTSIGGRLNSLDAQFDDNDARIVVTKEALSVLRDTDIAEAISQLSLEQTTLDAAQAVFARITSSSLFNFLR